MSLSSASSRAAPYFLLEIVPSKSEEPSYSLPMDMSRNGASGLPTGNCAPVDSQVLSELALTPAKLAALLPEAIGKRAGLGERVISKEADDRTQGRCSDRLKVAALPVKN